MGADGSFSQNQEIMRSHYNPILETQALESSKHLQQTFINLRKGHLRHGFEYTQRQ